MNPLILLSVLSGLGQVGGMFMHDNSRENMIKMYQRLLDPKSIAFDTNKSFAEWNASPAAAAAHQGALSGAMAGQNSLNSSFAQRGLLGTGLGGALPLGAAAGGLKLTEVNANMWQQLWEQVRQSHLEQANAGGSVMPKFTGNDKMGLMNDTLVKLLLAYATKGKK